jgi:hypothetical protein
MSDYIYRVRYDHPPLTATLTTPMPNHIDLQAEIRGLLHQLGATPLPVRREATSLEKIEAKALDPTVTEPTRLPKDMLEVPVPEDLTAPTALNETLLVKALNESELLVTVTDASLQGRQCDLIVRDLAVKIYEKGTGRKVAADEVEVERVGVLAYSICQHCHSSIHGLPHRCSHCGRAFCRLHATPSEHQCTVATTVPTRTIGHATPPHSKSEAKQSVSKPQPKIKVERVPCG